MSADETSPRSRVRVIFSVMLRIVLTLLLMLVLCIMTSSFPLVEIPFHFLLGWMLHGWLTLPPLLPYWTGILLPAACIVIAGFTAHRFILWWIKAKALPARWKPAQTIISMSLLLMVSGAAIAMSGITHQCAWLMSEPWTENRGKRIELTVAVNNARQLMMALDEYHDLHGRYPDSLQQLRSLEGFPENLLWFEPGRGKAREPFVLLTPGQERPFDERMPVIVSPLIGSAGKVVVGYSDSSVSSVYQVQFERSQQERKATRREATLSPHE